MCDLELRSTRIIVKSVFLACLIAGSASVATAQDYVSKAKRLLLAVDPELKSSLIVSLEDYRGLGDYSVFNGFRMDLFAPSTLELSNQPCRKPEVSAQFTFAAYQKNDRLLRFIVSHSPASHRLDEFTALVNKHPQWSDEQVISELAKEGAKYGPDKKESLLGVLASVGLEPFIGKFEVISSRFILRQQVEEKSPAEAFITWDVTVKTEYGDTYIITAEPFQGRIISVLRSI